MAPAKHGAQAHRGKAGGFMFQGKPGLHRCSEAAVQRRLGGTAPDQLGGRECMQLRPAHRQKGEKGAQGAAGQGSARHHLPQV